ncbi:hypothetical protein JTB14_026150 [Gonioctena quinquepunctata]|nr:hypothetical protein JTB14_026150 [Gonioctena quinquepunctata]
MTTFLVSAAELSNIFSVLAVLLCFCAMILFITRNMMVLRVNGEDFVFPTSLHQVPPRIPQMNMMKVHIPFTFKLLETSTSSYSELQCCTSSQVKYGMQVYWGVNIRELHIFLWRPWADLRDSCLNGDFLTGYYQYPGPRFEKKLHSDQNMTLKLDHTLELGTPPRLCYPLVVILFRNDVNENVHPDETVALINVIHIKDSVCTLPTSILAQYLKQANGQLSCLKGPSWLRSSRLGEFHLPVFSLLESAAVTVPPDKKGGFFSASLPMIMRFSSSLRGKSTCAMLDVCSCVRSTGLGFEKRPVAIL